MILTINLDPVESIPKLYDAIDSITRMVMDAKDNVDNPEIKAARQAIVDNAMKLLGAPVEPQAEKKKLTPREFALAALDFAKPLMKLDPKRTVDAVPCCSACCASMVWSCRSMARTTRKQIFRMFGGMAS